MARKSSGKPSFQFRGSTSNDKFLYVYADYVIGTASRAHVLQIPWGQIVSTSMLADLDTWVQRDLQRQWREDPDNDAPPLFK